MIKKILIGFGLLLNLCLCSIIIMGIMYYNGAFTDLTPQETAEELVATVKLYFDNSEETDLERAVIIDYDKVITGSYSNIEKITYLDRENQCEIPLIEVDCSYSTGLKLFKTLNGEILNDDVWKYLKLSVQYTDAIPYDVGYWREGEFHTERAYKLNFTAWSKNKELLEYVTMNNQKRYAPLIDKYGRFAGITVPCGNEDVLAVINPYYVFKLLECSD